MGDGGAVARDDGEDLDLAELAGPRRGLLDEGDGGKEGAPGISSAEATKFVEVATGVIQSVRDTGPAGYLVKRRAEVA